MKTNLEIDFDAADLPGGANAILGPSHCGQDVVKIHEYTIVDAHSIKVNVTLDENDPRVAEVVALLDKYGVQRWVARYDVYTEDELQAASLLMLVPWGHVRVLMFTNYDESQACPRCRTGMRQTSALEMIYRADLKKIEKLRVAGAIGGPVLVHDVDVERLLAAGVTGALFWPIYADTEAGKLEELRRQQIFPQHVMPPMSPKTLLDRSQVCPDCGRGWYRSVRNEPARLAYRREDLANIQDFNLTWEWFGAPPIPHPDGLTGGPPIPLMLVTPKVMNLLRGKTKKEQKYQGCEFVPIWIEDDTHDKRYVLT